MTPRDLRNIHTTGNSCRDALPCANMALKLPQYFYLLMEKPLGCYFQVWSTYYQGAQCNQKTLIPYDWSNKTSTLWSTFIVIPSLERWATKAKEATSPHEVRLTLLDTNPVFQHLGEIFWHSIPLPRWLLQN